MYREPVIEQDTVETEFDKNTDVLYNLITWRVKLPNEDPISPDWAEMMAKAGITVNLKIKAKEKFWTMAKDKAEWIHGKSADPVTDYIKLRYTNDAWKNKPPLHITARIELSITGDSNIYVVNKKKGVKVSDNSRKITSGRDRKVLLTAKQNAKMQRQELCSLTWTELKPSKKAKIDPKNLMGNMVRRQPLKAFAQSPEGIAHMSPRVQRLQVRTVPQILSLRDQIVSLNNRGKYSAADFKLEIPGPSEWHCLATKALSD